MFLNSPCNLPATQGLHILFLKVNEKAASVLNCLDLTKPVLGVSDKARHIPVSSATETRYNIAILLEASLDMILSSKRIRRAIVSLRRCTGWSAPMLFSTPENFICHKEAHI